MRAPEDQVGDARREVGLVTRERVDGIEHPCSRLGLDHVRPGAGRDRVAHEELVLVHAEGANLGLREVGPDLADGLEAGQLGQREDPARRRRAAAAGRARPPAARCAPHPRPPTPRARRAGPGARAARRRGPPQSRSRARPPPSRRPAGSRWNPWSAPQEGHPRSALQPAGQERNQPSERDRRAWLHACRDDSAALVRSTRLAPRPIERKPGAPSGSSSVKGGFPGRETSGLRRVGTRKRGSARGGSSDGGALASAVASRRADTLERPSRLDEPVPDRVAYEVDNRAQLELPHRFER